jgi:hypothetical protein
MSVSSGALLENLRSFRAQSHKHIGFFGRDLFAQKEGGV